MTRCALKFLVALCFGTVVCCAQTLSPKWEELTSPDFVKAIKKADGVCLLPMGSIEKFGPSGPLGTNLYVDRIVVLEAVKQEYAVVFPEYFVAGTNDVSNLAGVVAYSAHLQYEMLDETTREMARNGCKKILIVNGHSGNMGLINEFLSADLDKPRDYVVYSMYGPTFRVVPGMPDADKMPPAAAPSKPGADGHGGEERIAALLAYRPELVYLDRAHDESGSAGKPLNLPKGVQVGISRKAELPTGYEGDASGATVARGKALVEFATTRVVQAIQAIKADEQSPRLQTEFFEERQNPIQ
jgi:creatinine amidohydrolase